MSHSWTFCKKCGLVTFLETEEYCEEHRVKEIEKTSEELFVEKLSKEDAALYHITTQLYTIAGYPNKLWLLLTNNGKTHMAVFSDLMDSDSKLTINYHSAKVESIGSFVISGYKEQWRLPEKLVEMVTISGTDEDIIAQSINQLSISDARLMKIMSKLFPDYDDNKFKVYHMRKIWKWYTVIQQFKDTLAVHQDGDVVVGEPIEGTNAKITKQG